MSGSWVEFGDGTVPIKITLPMDYSSIKIENLPRCYSISSIVAMLATVGVKIPQDAVHLIKPPLPAEECFATITVADPSFAQSAYQKLGTCVTSTTKNLKISLRKVPGPRNSSMHQIDCRQVDISWDRPTRTAQVFFAKQGIAVGVHKRLSIGMYKICRRKVHAAKLHPQTMPPLQNPWFIELPGLAMTVKEEDITKDFRKGEQPFSVIFGEPSYEYDIDIQSTLVRSMLDEFGTLESWEFAEISESPRLTSKAVFADDLHACSASSALDGVSLPFSGGKLSVQQAITIRFKVLCRVYDAVQGQIISMARTWRAKGVIFVAFSSEGSYRNLRLRGASRPHIAKAQQELQLAIRGHVINIAELRKEGLNGFGPLDGITRQAMKKIEEDLSVVVVHDMPQSHLRIYGPKASLPKAQEAVRQIFQSTTEMSTYNILLDQPGELQWAIAGGIATLRSQIGPDKIVFHRDSRNLSIVRATVENIAEAKLVIARRQLQPLISRTDCPICLCEPEEPVRMSCSHIYCTSCFSSMCLDAAKKSNMVTCEGNAGDCSKVISLKDISEAVDLETLEGVLAASFSSYVRTHPKQFRCCPTPNCDRIYRVTSNITKTPITFSCSRCLTSICTACHVAHFNKTCGEHQGGAVRDHEALQLLKEELGIKDCSGCGAPIEKNGGCNHIVCGVCKSHICWRCEVLFKTSELCYAHMRKVHGGIGL